MTSQNLPPEPAPRAALMLVGTELLSGKIRDENGYFLAQLLRRRGIELVEIATIPDDIHEIASGFQRLARKATWLFSSGGVGPTHDDVTLEGLSRGLERPLHRHPQLEARLRGHYGQNCNDAVLRMSDVPSGTVLYGPESWPVLGVPFGLNADKRPTTGESHRVYILPGIPALFRQKLHSLEMHDEALPSEPSWELVEYEIAADESAFSADLDAVVAEFPDVAIGSYPVWLPDSEGRLRFVARITFESRNPGRSQLARDAMKKRWEERAKPSNDSTNS